MVKHTWTNGVLILSIFFIAVVYSTSKLEDASSPLLTKTEYQFNQQVLPEIYYDKSRPINGTKVNETEIQHQELNAKTEKPSACKIEPPKTPTPTPIPTTSKPIISKPTANSTPKPTTPKPTTPKPTTPKPTTPNPTTPKPTTSKPIISKPTANSTPKPTTPKPTTPKPTTPKPTTPKPTTPKPTTPKPTTPKPTTPKPTTPKPTTPKPTTPKPATPKPTTPKPTNPYEKWLPYKDTFFDWTNKANWEGADGLPLSDTQFTHDSITIRRDSRDGRHPIRTRRGWSGEKIIFIEFTNNGASDTNIWMLNTKINPQFGHNNGWPYFGELDIFEMFTEDYRKNPSDWLKGNVDYSHDIGSYGQMTFHHGGKHNPIKPVFCPSSHSRDSWYKGIRPMVSGCSAQFKNTPNERNTMAVVFVREGSKQYIDVMQYPQFEYGKDNTVNIIGHGDKTRVENSASLFWGAPANENPGQGHNSHSGFPFFEDFRLILEEQTSGGQFIVHNIKVYEKQ